MMAAITNPISIGWIFGVGPRVTSETLSGSSGPVSAAGSAAGSASASGFCVMALIMDRLGKQIAIHRQQRHCAADGPAGRPIAPVPASDTGVRCAGGCDDDIALPVWHRPPFRAVRTEITRKRRGRFRRACRHNAIRERACCLAEQRHAVKTFFLGI